MISTVNSKYSNASHFESQLIRLLPTLSTHTMFDLPFKASNQQSSKAKVTISYVMKTSSRQLTCCLFAVLLSINNEGREASLK